MMNQPKRLVLWHTDVMKMHGCGRNTASRKIKALKKYLVRQKKQPVTIEEYCSYFAIPYQSTLKFLELI